MRTVIALLALAALGHAAPAAAQINVAQVNVAQVNVAQTFVAPGQGYTQTGPNFQVPGQGPKVGDLEVKAFNRIPKAKTAVQLVNDSSLARNIRREVMVRLSRLGNEVGFSGGNVMRLDVRLGGRPSAAAPTTSVPSIEGPGSNPRLDLPQNRIGRRDGNIMGQAAGPMMRVTLTLYDVNGGKVLWAATASCYTQPNSAESAGIAMIDAIFADPNRSRIADAGCPL
jgi:hypothetical protein